MTAWYVDRNYPYTLDANAEKLNEAERNSILKNVYGGALHKVSSAINNSATSLIISSLIGVIFVGYYSNYAILLTGIMAILGAVFGPCCRKRRKPQRNRIGREKRIGFQVSSSCMFLGLRAFLRCVPYSGPIPSSRYGLAANGFWEWMWWWRLR